jgi:hypothetical protein
MDEIRKKPGRRSEDETSSKNGREGGGIRGVGLEVR